MKKTARLLGLLLAVMMLMQIIVIAPATASAEVEEDIYYITPNLSDGITVAQEDLEDLYVKGYTYGNNFIFTESKTLSFTAVFGEGWSYNATYSSIFPDDLTNRTVTVNNNNTVSVTYNATSGRSIPFADLKNIAINATAAQLPKLYMDIEGSWSKVNKEDYVATNFRLELGTKKFESGNYEGTGEVKGRGNTSWGMPQKPYTIKLEKKASLLDIPKTKKYAIIASYQDSSRMKDYLTYKLGQNLKGITYTPRCEFVDVYLNGSYNGIYILVERIDIESTKVDIEEATEENITGGYIIEKDAGDKVDKSKDPWFACPYRANSNGDLFTVKAPDPPTPEMLAYLEAHMQKLHNALMGISDEDYTKYIDISSWVDFAIVQEVAKNIDGNLKTSCYFYKEADNDVVYASALWDFDYAYGGSGASNGSSYNDRTDCANGSSADGYMVINSSCPWFKKLYYDKPDFSSCLYERYSEYRNTLYVDFFDMINEQGAYLDNSYSADAKKWTGKGSFPNAVKNLTNWTKNRLTWLDTQWYMDDYVFTHNVDVNIEGEGQLVAADGKDTVVDAKTKTYSIVPATGYEFIKVEYNGIDITDLVQNNTLETPIITDDAQLDVTFGAAAEVLDYTALTAAYNDAQAYLAQADKYEEDSFAALTQAAAAANAILTDGAEYQQQIVDAAAALNAAITGLVEYADVYSFTTNAPAYVKGTATTFTAVTDKDIAAIAFKNETGRAIVPSSMSKEIIGSKAVWTATALISTKGTRTVSLFADFGDGKYVDTGKTATFVVGIADVEGNDEAKVLDMNVPQYTETNEAFALTVNTSTSAVKVGIFDAQSGKALGKLSQSYVDKNGEREWTITLKVGTKGIRTFDVKAADASGKWSEGESFNLYVFNI